MASNSKGDDSAKETTAPVTVEKPSINKKRYTTLQKKAKILDLTEGGASIRQISERLTSEGWTGCSRSNVGKLLKAALEDCADELKLKAKHYVTLELNKMRRAELAHFARFLNETDPDKIAKLSSALSPVWRRIDALLGLHKPVKIDLKPSEALAKLLGRNPEEFPSGDVES